MVATVTQLKVRAPRTRPAARRPRRHAKFTGVMASGVLAVALVLTALSLTHLSHGIALVTGSPCWEAWSLAVGIDLGFVALELASLAPLPVAAERACRRYSRPAIIGTLVASAGLNAMAFTAGAAGWMIYPAAAFGLAIPGLIYFMTRVGAEMWLAK